MMRVGYEDALFTITQIKMSNITFRKKFDGFDCWDDLFEIYLLIKKHKRNANNRKRMLYVELILHVIIISLDYQTISFLFFKIVCGRNKGI